MNNRLALGGARVTRVVETQVQMRTSLFADTPPAQAWDDNADLLEPHFWIVAPNSGASLCSPGWWRSTV